MKQCAVRRRSKRQIAEDKQAKIDREAEVEEKMARFRQMEQQIMELQQNAMDQQKVKDTLDGLQNAGLLKGDGQGNYEAVGSFEEHQQLVRVRQQESMIASQHDQRVANEMQLQNDPDEMRASQQLELIEDGSVPMNDEELSETHSVIQTRRQGKSRKN